MEHTSAILIFNEQFQIISKILPESLSVIIVPKLPPESSNTTPSPATASKNLSAAHSPAEAPTPPVIYDLVFLNGFDYPMYAFSSSHHTITVVKDVVSLQGKKHEYSQYMKFYHASHQFKLCWSKTMKVLCSVCTNNTILGWALDKQDPLFHISRHTDTITGFLALDPMNMFLTCSIDKKIVLWGGPNYRIKFVLTGHTSGVRGISYYENVLLSFSFDNDAFIWDMGANEQTAVLCGHRTMIVIAKLMCEKAKCEKDYRAITVDQTGEFRLWNIFVAEREKDVTPISAIQTFEMFEPEAPINHIAFLALPYNPKYSCSHYSNLVACSSTLLHFCPVKNGKEFIPPTASVYNHSCNCVAITIGKNLLTYDMCTGSLLNVVRNMHHADLTALCLDESRGRRLFVGCDDGSLLLVNFSTGLVCDLITPHSNEITCAAFNSTKNAVFIAGVEGKISSVEETAGKLRVQYHSDYLFKNADGKGVTAVATMRLLPSLRAVLLSSAGPRWGMWQDNNFCKLLVMEETSPVAAIEVVGASGYYSCDDHKGVNHRPNTSSASTSTHQLAHDRVVTVAVASAYQIQVYCIDLEHLVGVISYSLTLNAAGYILSMALVAAPLSNCANYSSSSAQPASALGRQLVVATDDGILASWAAHNMLQHSEDKLHTAMQALGLQAPIQANTKDTTHLFLTQSSSIQISKKKFIKSSRDALATTFFQPSIPERVTECRRWSGHGDTILSVLPIHQHGGILSVSFDGYIRVWTLYGKYLGEAPLMNIADSMKSQRSTQKMQDTWKFFVEKVPLENYHEKAETFVRRAQSLTAIPSNLLTKPKRYSESTVQNQRANFMNQQHRLSPMLDEPSQPVEQLRTQMLRSLSAPGALDAAVPIRPKHNASTSSTASSSSNISCQTLSTLNSKSTWQSTQEIAEATPIKAFTTPAAFTESSLNQYRINGTLDAKELQSLKQVSLNSDLVAAYERQTEIVMLRDTKTACRFELPVIEEIKKSEINFGPQKHIYKNANKYIEKYSNISHKKVVHAVSLSRIQQNVRNVNSMIHVLAPAELDSLPEHDETTNPTTSNSMTARLLKSKAAVPNDLKPKQLDLERLEKVVDKYKQAMEGADIGKDVVKSFSLKTLTLTPYLNEDLDKKVYAAISDRYQHQQRLKTAQPLHALGSSDSVSSVSSIGNKSKIKKNARLSRQLLPYYTLENVHHFMDIFAKFDMDFNGELNRQEWVKLFTHLNKNVSTEEIQILFLNISRESEGVTLNDLIPIIFKNASKEQLKLICKYSSDEFSSFRDDTSSSGQTQLTTREIEQLFEYYDVKSKGFITLGTIKDRIKGLLANQEQVAKDFLNSISTKDDEQLLGPIDFHKMFKFLTKK